MTAPTNTQPSVPGPTRQSTAVLDDDRPLASVQLPAPAAGPADADAGPSPDAIRRAAVSYRDFRWSGAKGDALDSWAASFTGEQRTAARMFRDAHRANPQAAGRLAEAVANLPDAGHSFLGFELQQELGRGAFARVFLALQSELADRPVVLKVSADRGGESQTLAQLQHTNIVPIFSVHRTGLFQALCMPYMGSITLADVYQDLKGLPSLPDSGRGLVSTLCGRRNSTVQRSHSSSGPAPSSVSDPASVPSAREAPVSVPGRGRDAVATLKMLEGLSYVEAVLWMGARLADGLAHAHERGIVHRDLKPANVLLTDEGQPMLLDFNLSEDPRLRGSPEEARMGGTLPYMSPEQLQAFRGDRLLVDSRSDLYSLGVILFELLTRKHPFPSHRRFSQFVALRMLEDRQQPPRLRGHNPAVSPAVEAIIRKCLAPDPDQRYQSALELKEDLERQLSHRPLKYVREPSLRERLGKWRRRHPSLSSAASLGAITGAVCAGLLAALLARGERLAKLQAADDFRRTGEEMLAAQIHLTDRAPEPGDREKGTELARAALDRYQVLGGASWRESPSARRLSREELDRLAEHVGTGLFLLARTTQDQAIPGAARTSPVGQLHQALELNTLALACFDSREAPRALWEQRAGLLGRLGDRVEERKALQHARTTPAGGSLDLLLLAQLYTAQGNYRRALVPLRQLTQQDPQNYTAWFLRGVCHYELLQDAEAAACFNSCIALKPEIAKPWYNRGLAHRRQRHFEQARDDFDRFITLQPDSPKGYVNRALAREGLRDFDGAVQDLTQALELAERHEEPLTSIYFKRAAVRARANDPDGAAVDRAEALKRQPTDEAGFIDRGLARVQSDPKAALADFEAALKLNPKSFDGLQNKAAILVDKFGRDAEALAVMDQAVRLYPDSVLALGGRGVLLARVGKRDKALEDAQSALLVDTSPATLYQVACIYALTSKNHAEDRLKAFQLLSSALGKGYGLELIDHDTDLDPIRAEPEYRRLVQAARALGAAGR